MICPFKVSANSMVELTFVDFDVEASRDGNCRFDYVEGIVRCTFSNKTVCFL